MIDSLATIFGVCIALVAAVLGLAYPMFVQSVNGLAVKYGARGVSEKFEKEFLYRTLKQMLKVCVIGVVVSPFVILVCNSYILNILLSTTLAICVFILCFAVIGTCDLLVVYGDPSRYLKRVSKKLSSEDIFQILQILIVRGSRKESNDDLYNDAILEFGRQIIEFQHECVIEWRKSKGGDKDNNIFIYPSHIFQPLLQIKRRSADPENVILNKQTDIVEFLYNFSDDFPITNQVYYSLMWPWICGMVDAKYDDWVKNYWSIATRYYNFKLDQSDNKDEKGKFLEFHLMLGVLLLYQKRYDVLRYAFTFTNSHLPKYPLIPNTFSQIFECYKNIPIGSEPLYLSKYNMFENFEGTNTEYRIEVLLLEYIALLMVRLFSVNDYNITFSDPMSLPNAESTVEGNEYKINIITAIIGHLEDIPDDTLEALDFKPEWRQKAVTLLEKFIGKCEAKNQDLPERRVVSEEKRKRIRRQLIEALDNNNPSLPSSNEENKKDESKKFFSELEKPMSNELILDNHLGLWSNLEESMIQGLHIQQRMSYCSKILQNRAIKTYSISYRDFERALRQLCLTPDYTIVAIGVSAHLYTEIPAFNVDENGNITYGKTGEKPIKVYNIPSYPEDTVLIMKDKDVPKFRYRKLEDDEYVKDELSEIETERHLYSNIDNIKADNPVLRVKQGFYIDMSAQLNYVCIRILYQLEPDTTVVSKVESIKNLIKKLIL